MADLKKRLRQLDRLDGKIMCLSRAPHQDPATIIRASAPLFQRVGQWLSAGIRHFDLEAAVFDDGAAAADGRHAALVPVVERGAGRLAPNAAVDHVRDVVALLPFQRARRVNCPLFQTRARFRCCTFSLQECSRLKIAQPFVK